MASIEKTLEQTHITLTSAINNPEVVEMLSQFGYGMGKLQEGLTLYQTASQHLQLQHGVRRYKVNATRSFNTHFKEAQFHYRHDLRCVRWALKAEGESNQRLPINNRPLTAFESWHAQASEFYLTLQNDPELQAVAATGGVTAERIGRGLEMLQTLKDANVQQQVNKGKVSGSLRQRKEAFAALNQWMDHFRKIAEVALAIAPEHLTTLGLGAESRRRKKKVAPMMVVPATTSPSTVAALAQ